MSFFVDDANRTGDGRVTAYPLDTGEVWATVPVDTRIPGNEDLAGKWWVTNNATAVGVPLDDATAATAALEQIIGGAGKWSALSLTQTS